MKKIVFDKIQVQNFLSYGNDPVVLEFTNGVNFITGYNKDDDSRNGVGKTSLIVESLSFALFGKTYRKITQKEIRNRKEDATCSVSLWYTINNEQYRITRSLSPNTLTRHRLVDGEAVDNQTKTIAETTKDILNDLGITKEVFENTLVMTAKNSEPFFSQDKSLKTKFIEGILGLECFSELFKKAKEDYNAFNSELSKKQSAFDMFQKTYHSDLEYEKAWDTKHIHDLLEIDAEINHLKSVQPNNTKDISDDLQTQLHVADNELTEKAELKSKLDVKDAEINATLQHLNSSIKKLSIRPDKCPTCKRAFEDSCKDELQAEIDNLQKSIEENSSKKDKISQAKNNIIQVISNIKKNISSLKQSISDIEKEQQLFDKAQDKINSLVAKKQSLETTENPFVEKNKKSKDSLEEMNNELNDSNSELRILDALKIVFSPTGVKSTVIEKIMSVFNNRLSFYLEKLNTPCTIEFDEFFDETVKSLKGDTISYDSLSEGEKGRVNFALLFAFRDIRRLQSNVNINISVFDELFDSSIDSKASTRIMDLLQEMSEEHDDCYYIITHNEQNVNIDNANIIFLEKENGITTIKPTVI